MRVSDVATQDLLLALLEKNRAAVARAQIALASGRKYQARSDAPAEAAMASRLQASVERDEQWRKNVESALTWARVTETRVSQAIEQLQQAHEVVIQARDGTYNSKDRREHLAVQVDAILESLVLTANVTYDGKYLFGGTDSASAPVTVTRDAEGRISAVNYAPTPPNPRTIQISADSVLRYGVTAVGNGNGLFVNDPGTPSETSLFDTLIVLRDTLSGTAMPSDAQLTEVQEGLDNAIVRLVDTGVQQARLEALRTQSIQAAPAVAQRISHLQDTDIAKVATELSLMQTSLMAAMKVAARGSGMNLADYI